jgi:two-component system, OmpR family, response regulator BaeR
MPHHHADGFHLTAEMGTSPLNRLILIAEDDQQGVHVLTDQLTRTGFVPIHTNDGRDALRLVQIRSPVAIVLSTELRTMDGFDACGAIRRVSNAPILMLGEMDNEIGSLIGLELGADQYVSKPYGAREIVARLRALVRRSEGRAREQICVAGLLIDELMERVLWAGHTIPLSGVEYRLLRTLVSKPGVVFTREVLLNALHGEFRDVSDRAIDAHIKNLRQKLRQFAPDKGFIYSVYGEGYRFTDAVS